MNNFKSACLAAAQKAAPVVVMCASAFATNMAHAGWIADFLCWSDNSPALCRSHLPDILKLTKQPSSSGTTETVKIPVTEKTSQPRLAVIQPGCKGGLSVWAGPEGKGGCTPGLPDLHKK
ncbi:MAG: hypothetical protein Q8K87_12255 [Hydrogenophaga sp.]|nr:hypothetical protein [Hydrogenophaga sp.]MDZ4238680.1 hypothetical protein [Hydrogenophaga sp.]